MRTRACASWLVETPVLESEAINRRVGRARSVQGRVPAAHGQLQDSRRAESSAAASTPTSASAGVVAFSSGNHAQAVALAARWLRYPATIVMPADAPKVKLERTRAFGAEVVLYDREREDREAIAARLAEQRGAALVPPFDHPHVIAGQGTLALELARVARARHARARRALRAVQRRRARRGLRARDQGRVAGLRRVCRRAARVRGHCGIAGGRASGERSRPAARRCATGCARRRRARSRSRSIGASSRARSRSTTQQIRSAMALAAQAAEGRASSRRAPRRSRRVLRGAAAGRQLRRRRTVGRQRRCRTACRRACELTARDEARSRNSP